MKGRTAAKRLWGPGCWTCAQPSSGCACTIQRLLRRYSNAQARRRSVARWACDLQAFARQSRPVSMSPCTSRNAHEDEVAAQISSTKGAEACKRLNAGNWMHVQPMICTSHKKCPDQAEHAQLSPVFMRACNSGGLASSWRIGSETAAWLRFGCSWMPPMSTSTNVTCPILKAVSSS